ILFQLDDEAALTSANSKDHSSVILIEDISLDWIVTLGCTFDIHTSFFFRYLTSSQGPSPWKAVFGNAVSDHKRPTRFNHPKHINLGQVYRGPSMFSYHIDGVFQLGQSDQMRSCPRFRAGTSIIHRRIENHALFGWEAATRMSYCQINENLYLFLVDGSIKMDPLDNRPIAMPTLHFPVSNSRGGLVLPALFDDKHYSLFETLKQFFSHAWHFDVLTGKKASAETFMYVLVASTWLANLRATDQKLKRVAFADIRRPNIKLNDQLHDFRELLALFQTQVSSAKNWMPGSVRAELEETRHHLHADSYVGFPDSTFDSILAETEAAGRFLMDTFQLLMSSISVLDSETSIRQARSGQKLTQLASIFIPLSLVTGIFGMNIKEINDSPLSIWVVVVTVVITVLCTIGVFRYLDQREKQSSKNKSLLSKIFSFEFGTERSFEVSG
ncbi:NAD(P)-binding protein, partial [Apiospora arundinis]